MEDHKYIDFIKGVMKGEHKIQWDEKTANIVLKKSSWKVKATFSYNETKIYFDYGNPYPMRVLDDQLSVRFINDLDGDLFKVNKTAGNYEG